MRAEYTCGVNGWKAEWQCVSCGKHLCITRDAEITFVNSICARCLDRLLQPVSFSQHSYGIAIDVT
jgi:hypothetical protein